MRPIAAYAPVWASDSRYIARDRKLYAQTPHVAAEHPAPAESASDDEPSSPEQDYRRPRTNRAGRKDQFYVAGWDPSKELPVSFPHADKVSRPGYTRSVQVKRARGDESRPQQKPSLQRQHFAVVTAILHASLLRGDWARAGRAWGLLLHTVHAGKYLDIRANGRWGIGAEILLRQGAEKHEDVDMQMFSQDAFRAAKDYYEQLILQYPYNKHAPDAVANAVDFYPALFGICIYEAVCTSAKAIADLDASPMEMDYNPDESSATRHNAGIAVVKRAEAATASQLATRLDSVLAGPPYDRHTQLLQLRGMISMWLADLHGHLARLESTELGIDGVKVESGMSDDARQAAIERAKSRRHLNKAIDAGGSLPESLQTYLADS